jgi:hypothetical protein
LFNVENLVSTSLHAAYQSVSSARPDRFRGGSLMAAASFEVARHPAHRARLQASRHRAKSIAACAQHCSKEWNNGFARSFTRPAAAIRPDAGATPRPSSDRPLFPGTGHEVPS